MKLDRGTAIGLGFAALLELSNARVWHEKELEGLVPGRILVGAALAMTLAIAAGNLYSFYKG